MIPVEIAISKRPFAESRINGTVGPHNVELQSEAWLARRSAIVGTIDDGEVRLDAQGRLFGSQQITGELPIGQADLAVGFSLRRITVTGTIGPDAIDLTILRSVLKPMKIEAAEGLAAVHLEMAKRLKSGVVSGEVVRPADAFVIAAVSPTLLAIFDRRA